MYNVLYTDGVHEGQHRRWDCLESRNLNDLAVLFSDLKLYTEDINLMTAK